MSFKLLDSKHHYFNSPFIFVIGDRYIINEVVPVVHLVQLATRLKLVITDFGMITKLLIVFYLVIDSVQVHLTPIFDSKRIAFFNHLVVFLQSFLVIQKLHHVLSIELHH